MSTFYPKIYKADYTKDLGQSLAELISGFEQNMRVSSYRAHCLS